MPHPWETNWVVGERLGKGGQGITHKVSRRDDASSLGALKYLKNNHCVQARGRMRREVANLQALANLCKSVPRVLDHNTEEFEDVSAELFVVMDLIDGPTLDEFVDMHGPLDIDTTIPIVLSLCRTVQVAHSFPLLHRDLKPQNVIVRHGNVDDVVVVDYGLSFSAGDEHLTETNETFRNRFLDLPETNTPSGNRCDQRSDLTAICAILYFCLTKTIVGQLQDGSGRLPHFREGATLRCTVENDARLAQTEAFLTRGLAPNMANRFQDVSEIVDKLKSLCASSKTVDESDPLQMAISLSEQVRAKDRKIQVADLAKVSQVLFQSLEREYKKYHGKLGLFSLSLPAGGYRPNMILPDGLDLVFRWMSVLTLQRAHHSKQLNRQYLVAASGEHCVVLAADYQTDAKRPTLGAENGLREFQEIGRYEGSPEPVFEVASISLRDWITKAMKALAESD